MWHINLGRFTGSFNSFPNDAQLVKKLKSSHLRMGPWENPTLSFPALIFLTGKLFQ